MCSYSMTNGIPNCANGALFNSTGLVRSQWNFSGHVVTDCGAIKGIFDRDHHAKSLNDASLDALAAGVDASCGTEYATALPDLLGNRSSLSPAQSSMLSQLAWRLTPATEKVWSQSGKRMHPQKAPIFELLTSVLLNFTTIGMLHWGHDCQVVTDSTSCCPFTGN